MKTISNEEKAHRICETMTLIYGVDIAQEAHIYSTALEAMKWKDELHAKEKQQWIDKACEWLKGNTDMWIGFIDGFKKEMKGE